MSYDPLDSIEEYNKDKKKEKKKARKEKLKQRQENSWKRQNESRKENAFGKASGNSNSGSSLTKGKDKSILEKKLWKRFSKYIRLRDCLRTTFEKNMCRCVTCGRKVKDKKGYLHAGHFISKSIAKGLKFDERNVHGQCGICNTNGGGKPKLYRKNMKILYGSKLLEEFDKPGVKWEVKKYGQIELEDMLDKYKQKYRTLDRQGINISEHKKRSQKYDQLEY